MRPLYEVHFGIHALFALAVMVYALTRPAGSKPRRVAVRVAGLVLAGSVPFALVPVVGLFASVPLAGMASED